MKECSEKRNVLSWAEWCEVSFDIYMLHMVENYNQLLKKCSGCIKGGVLIPCQ
ncbi:hypothetical protein H257_03274 [Aphanomyces astaci]|uniref:Uncharacterized protein n=1 Tax=Aphanomyces astaci TaxID=112090 RepID=W4H1Y0_APHAT|nr:hypothetical protein H257_03274 [Aphanomyces astaci]ETV85566.1 hypothetical protein H257_03274 [Aphanomyces astaci]|eukprot:XP_009825584.1 hypothetical protein H257_03274 [Aphanomyces astaci]